MNFIEKIIRFFSRKEVPQLPEMSLNEQIRRDFIARNRVDPKDLLDPKVCKGEKFIENILIACGVDLDIAKSPITKAEVEEMFFFIVEADPKLKIDIHKDYEISSDVIKACVKKLKKAQKDNELKTTIENSNNKFLIDSKGRITIIGDIRSKEDKTKNGFSKRGIKKICYNEAARGIVVKEEYNQFYRNSENNPVQNEEHETITEYNSQNIMISKKDKSVEEFYEGLDVYHISETRRDKKFPFIIHQSLGTKNYEDEQSGKTVKRTIFYNKPSNEYLDLYLLKSATDLGNQDEGIQVIGDSPEEIKEYYETNKESIQKLLLEFEKIKTRNSKGCSFYDLYNYIMCANLNIKNDLEQRQEL